MTPPCWLARESAARFAAFRIVLGIVLLADVTHLYSHRALFSDEWQRLVPLGLALIIWAVVLSVFIAGLYTRAAAFANYLCAVFLLGQPSAISQVAGDSVAISLSLLAVFFPCGNALSLDRWVLQPARAPQSFAAARWALAAYLSMVYVDSGLRKLFTPMWRAGLGVVAPVGLPSLVWIDTSWLGVFPPLLLRLVGWGVIVFELSFPALYAWRGTRTPAVLTGIALHLGIAVIYPFPAFSGLMLAIYAGLLPEKWYSPLRRLDACAARRVLVRKPGRVGSGLSSPLWPRLRSRWRLAKFAAVLWLSLSVLNFAVDITPAGKFRHVWDRGRPLLFATTGLMDHGVFDDVLFSDYRYQLRLLPGKPIAGATAMPYARDGLLTWSVRDRVWEHWWKRTQAPWVSLREAEARLARWAAYYWPPTDQPQAIRIEVRPQTIALADVDTAVFRKNSAVAWRELGTIRLARDKAPELIWEQRPDPDEKWFGDFILRVLTQESP
jgi:hypothetical protein